MLRTLLVFFLALSLAASLVALLWHRAEGATIPSTSTPPNQTDKQEDPPKKNAQDKKKQEEKQEPILAQFMRKKLGGSNKVLKGLMTDDFNQIEEGADALMKMSLAEEWRVSKDPSYARFSLSYQDTVRKLKTKAKKGNIDGAALAWMDVTMSCIECHEWVRNVMIADNDLQPSSPMLAKYTETEALHE